MPHPLHVHEQGYAHRRHRFAHRGQRWRHLRRCERLQHSWSGLNTRSEWRDTRKSARHLASSVDVVQTMICHPLLPFLCLMAKHKSVLIAKKPTPCYVPSFSIVVVATKTFLIKCDKTPYVYATSFFVLFLVLLFLMSFLPSFWDYNLCTIYNTTAWPDLPIIIRALSMTLDYLLLG